MNPPPPYDGRHLIADLHGCTGLDDVAAIERLLRDAATAAGAALLEIRLHAFGPGQGVTGVALLAESHISIHSWPEHGYAALDFFLCGARHDLEAALAVIVAGLAPREVARTTVRRGYGAL
ncbi:adenosylmethionine decarboxylase [Sphingomonas profundi]|uniref:adenosylmethionine decarboxylase n=1 Tax=Alterirhizorhabdus profundi TaxID=2681549 RepID=UPI0012E795C9|nr:adenosylmethionine decarboxylase [Sphingomonas profundi]